LASEQAKIKVAAYCRVSTDKADQQNSLMNQKTFFAEYVNRNPTWELIQVYADEGVTGTSTKKRYAFHQMIEDAAARKFDLILTKEISRFARNTLDSIYYTRKLKELGIGVLFLNDNINTLDADSELRLTIMASIAQEESRKTSERVKWGQRRRMEAGVVFGRDLLGYDVKNGKLTINKKGAEVVRLIFHKFVNEGKGTHIIARELCEAGIPTATHQSQWSNTAVLRILKNEKYCGDLVQKKTYTPNFLDHQKRVNRGEEELIILKDHHEPIVSRELFEKAQAELARRSPDKAQRAKHSNRHCFSGKIKCGTCNRSFVARSKKRKDGSIYRAWRCYENARHGRRHTDSRGNQIGCNMRSLNEKDVKEMLMRLLRSLDFDKETVSANILVMIEKVTKENAKEDTAPLQQQIEALTAKKRGVIELYLSNTISKADLQELTAKYERQITLLQQRLAESKLQEQPHSEPFGYDMKRTVLNLVGGIEWDDVFYRNLLEQIVMQEDGALEVALRGLPHRFRCYID
jgi:site-specific DNA recombinase